MEIIYSSSFFKSIKKEKNKEILEKIEITITNVKDANSINEISNIKKLSGHKTYYRIKIGDYRLGIEIINEIVDFMEFQHCKDIYKKFP
ncbi:type II toxin-antitoxin system RelE/ParE family toxin [Flavobacterium sp.]|uniref:type II toxin-antitoxin system RelE family toxin n=1 Tax=Flavobacterium sp. TaxID=239 RepID=UPI0037511D2C